jgi:hypothetical protein
MAGDCLQQGCSIMRAVRSSLIVGGPVDSRAHSGNTLFSDCMEPYHDHLMTSSYTWVILSGLVRCGLQSGNISQVNMHTWLVCADQPDQGGAVAAPPDNSKKEVSFEDPYPPVLLQPVSRYPCPRLHLL